MGAVLVTPERPGLGRCLGAGRRPALAQRCQPGLRLAGGCLGRCVEPLGITGVSARRQGYLSCTRWSPLVCFGGVGTGEVATDDGRKVAGLAQRRNRDGAWFHSCLRRALGSRPRCSMYWHFTDRAGRPRVDLGCGRGRSAGRANWQPDGGPVDRSCGRRLADPLPCPPGSSR